MRALFCFWSVRTCPCRFPSFFCSFVSNLTNERDLVMPLGGLLSKWSLLIVVRACPALARRLWNVSNNAILIVAAWGLDFEFFFFVLDITTLWNIIYMYSVLYATSENCRKMKEPLYIYVPNVKHVELIYFYPLFLFVGVWFQKHKTLKNVYASTFYNGFLLL